MSLRGEAGWAATNKKVFGEERWAALSKALEAPVTHCCLLNTMLTPEAQEGLVQEYKLKRTTVPLAYSFEIPKEESETYKVVEDDSSDVIFCDPAANDLLGGAAEEEDGGDRLGGVTLADLPDRQGYPRKPMPFYFLDGASVIAALALRPDPEDSILDMCAAPGGKSLVLATQMFQRYCGKDMFTGAPGKLVCNEFSKSRCRRLQKALNSFLPPQLFQKLQPNGPNISFTCADGTLCSSTMEKAGPFDKILIDAPCSTDRHLKQQGAVAMSRWSTGTPKVNAERQLKLLTNAIWLLKDGGVLLYATCALSPHENDQVVEKFLKKAKKQFELEVLPVEEEVQLWVPMMAAESTDWGVSIMPDKTGYGPLYFARIRKVR